MFFLWLGMVVSARLPVPPTRTTSRGGMYLDNPLLDETEKPWTWMSNAFSPLWSA